MRVYGIPESDGENVEDKVIEKIKEEISSIDFGKILHTIFDSDQPFTIQSPKPSQSRAL